MRSEMKPSELLNPIYLKILDHSVESGGQEIRWLKYGMNDSTISKKKCKTSYSLVVKRSCPARFLWFKIF